MRNLSSSMSQNPSASRTATVTRSALAIMGLLPAQKSSVPSRCPNRNGARESAGSRLPGDPPGRFRSEWMASLEEMQSPPYKARVDFYMVYYSPSDHSEIRRDLYTANFVFVFKTSVPNELIPINPLGLAITYFREDEAFK